jgi:large subunit ribosomal protein L30
MERPPSSLRSPPPEGDGEGRSGSRAGADVAGQKKMRVTLVKSVASCKEGHRATVRGLGLKWTHHSVEVVDTPATRGMVAKVGYLVKVTDSNG